MTQQPATLIDKAGLDSTLLINPPDSQMAFLADYAYRVAASIMAGRKKAGGQIYVMYGADGSSPNIEISAGNHPQEKILKLINIEIGHGAYYREPEYSMEVFKRFEDLFEVTDCTKRETSLILPDQAHLLALLNFMEITLETPVTLLDPFTAHGNALPAYYDAKNRLKKQTGYKAKGVSPVFLISFKTDQFRVEGTFQHFAQQDAAYSDVKIYLNNEIYGQIRGMNPCLDIGQEAADVRKRHAIEHAIPDIQTLIIDWLWEYATCYDPEKSGNAAYKHLLFQEAWQIQEQLCAGQACSQPSPVHLN
ncbi:MAG: hypothetical protein KGM99_13165 [Burkholderiales bacterium]|nr:hypothetical protein [Burkholderiales bacterium]